MKKEQVKTEIHGNIIKLQNVSERLILIAVKDIYPKNITLQKR